MKRLLPLILMAGAWPSQNALAQRPVETECGTYLPEHNPRVQEQAAALRQLARRVSAGQQQQTRRATIAIIPVVVHIIHDYSPATNITRAKVLDGLRMLNDDFNYRNPDTVSVVPPFKQLVANVQVEFRLATLDPSGNCTDGITRTYSTLTQAANNIVKSLIRWDPARYLNIWVVGNIASGAGAYATFPCGPSWNDGIVCRADRLGFTYSHTISHESGHYLGLDHTWGPGPVGLASNCSLDDGVADTPNTIGSSVPVCNTSQVYCGNLVNIQNIMDYGGCLIMFTHGQKAVMQNALQLPCRASLWDPVNLQSTGTADGVVPATCIPVADFIASSTTTVCQGGSVEFTDLSYNASPDSSWTWLWSFPGGTPATSTAQNPLITYNSPGLYAVALTVTNSAGTDTINRTDYVRVMTTTALQAPLTESYESPAFPAVPTHPEKAWTITSGSSSTWQRTGTAAADSLHSLRIDHQSIPQGEVNSLITPNISLAGVVQPVLRFAVAYAPSAAAPTAADALRVFISSNCGLTWTRRYLKSGSALATAPAIAAGAFVPAAAQWRTETVPLTISSPHVMLKFESSSDQGNTLYLDAVSVQSASATAIPEAQHPQGLAVYPNPTQGQALIRYQLPQQSHVHLRLLSSTGRLVASQVRVQQPGQHEQPLQDLTGHLPAGLYLLQLQVGATLQTVKVAVYGGTD